MVPGIAALNSADPNGANPNGADHNSTEHNGTGRNGTDQNGTDLNGADHNGTDHSGADQNGTDQNGVDQSGIDHNGTDHSGTDQNGTDQNGVDQSGIDHNGTDLNGTDHNGTDHNGVDRNSVDQNGITHVAQKDIADNHQNGIDVSQKDVAEHNKGGTVVRIPDCYRLFMSRTARVNKWYHDVKLVSDKWVKKVLSLDEKHFIQYQKADFAFLAATFVPDADVEGLRLMADWLAWIFYVDDLFDEGSLQDDPEAARAESDAILCTYTDNHPLVSASEHPIRAMGQGLWKRIQQKGSKDLAQRYVEAMRHYFGGQTIQVHERCMFAKYPSNSLTTVDFYLHYRTHSIGVRPVQVMLAIIYGIDLPGEVFDHPAVKQAEEALTRIILLQNDILSFRKEQFMHTPGNYPPNIINCLMHERGYSIQRAFDHTDEIVQGCMKQYQSAQVHVPSWGEQIDKSVQKYLEGIEDECRGNLEWSFGTGRYLGKDNTEVRSTLMMRLDVDGRV